MIKSEILNSLINQAFENKQGKSSQNTNPTKSGSAKAKLRHLMTGNPSISKQTEGKSTITHSISHHRSSLDGPNMKDHQLVKSYQLNESARLEKISENSKANNTVKPHHSKTGSFFKDRSSKPKTLQINTNYTISTNQDLIGDFKVSSAKNSTSMASQQQINQIFAKENSKLNLADLKQLHPQSVKNANSKTFEYFSTRPTNPVPASCSNKAALSPHQSTSTSTAYHHQAHKSMSIQPNNVVKMLSPQKVKPDEERTGITEILVNNTKKAFDKRRYSYRNRRSGQMSEVHDDLTSKMSTKTPSQFSDIRSFPSHKSRSMVKHDTPEKAENNFKEQAQVHKPSQNQNAEVKGNENKGSTVTKNKNAAIGKDSVSKEANTQSGHKILNRKAKSSAFVQFDFLDAPIKEKSSLGSLLKSVYEQKRPSNANVAQKTKKVKKDLQTSKDFYDLSTKKNDDQYYSGTKKQSLKTASSNNDRDQIIKGKKFVLETEEKAPATPVDYLNTQSSKGYGYSYGYGPLEMSEDVHSVSLVQHDSLDNQFFGLQTYKGFQGENDVSSSNLRKDTQGSFENDPEIGKLITDIIKRSNIDEIKHNPHAKFLSLRKQVHEKRATRNTRSFDPQRFMQEVESKMPISLTKIEPRRVASLERESTVEKNTKSLNNVFKRTKLMLETYQEREKEWIQEKEDLLLKIERLEKMVGEINGWE